MTTKEVLKEMCDYCRKSINQIPSNGDRPYKECPFRGISGDYCESYETIKKDLEILDILKKYVYFSSKSNCVRMKDIYKRTTNFDYETLKEWLENE